MEIVRQMAQKFLLYYFVTQSEVLSGKTLNENCSG